MLPCRHLAPPDRSPSGGPGTRADDGRDGSPGRPMMLSTLHSPARGRSHAPTDDAPTVLCGATCCTERRPTPRLERDLDLMGEVGFSIIRIGESVWSAWEPGGRALRPRLARVGARRRLRAGDPRRAREPDLRRAAVDGPPPPRDRRRHRVGDLDVLGRAAGGRLHPSCLPLLRQARDSREHAASPALRAGGPMDPERQPAAGVRPRLALWHAAQCSWSPRSTPRTTTSSLLTGHPLPRGARVGPRRA